MVRKGIENKWFTTIEIRKATKRRLDRYARVGENNDRTLYRLLSEIRKWREFNAGLNNEESCLFTFPHR